LQVGGGGRPADVAHSFAEIEQIKRNYRRLETFGIPVVACLNGAALGGGWEVARGPHARTGVGDARIRFGMPEVSLGLIPGASGITKTVRLLGLDAARPLLLDAKLFGPTEAVHADLVPES